MNKTRRMLLNVISAVCIFLSPWIMNKLANAASLNSTVEFGNHRYMLATQAGITWDEARVIAARETLSLADGTILKGHLLTINSQDEQDFVSNTFMDVPFRHLLLGGYQFSSDVEPDGNWAWITGEEIGNINTDWSFSFLDAGQPGDDPNPVVGDNLNPVNREDSLQMLINAGTGSPIGTLNDRWNDFNRGSTEESIVRFVIEFDEIGDNFVSLTAPPSIVSGSHWRSNNTLIDGWETVAFDDSAWPFARAPYPSPTPPKTLIPGTNAEYMWHDPVGTSDGTNGPVRAFFRFTFNVDLETESRPLLGKAKIAVDDDYDLYVNGNLVFENHDDGGVDIVDTVDFSSSLQDGKNVIAIQAVDGGWNNPQDRVNERVLFDANVSPLADLLVISSPSEADPGTVLRYDGKVGAFIGRFGGGCNPVDLTFGPDGKLYIADRIHPQDGACDPDNFVTRFDGKTGEYGEWYDPHANFVPLFQDDRFLFGPGGLAFGPDGNLYISDPKTNSIHRYQGPFGANPGSFIDTFVSTGSGGLIEPRRLTFGPDNNLYVASDSILRYEGPLSTNPGAFIDAFVSTGDGGLDSPADLVFGPDKKLYVSNRSTDNILRYEGPMDTTPGKFERAFVPSGSGGLNCPSGLAFGADLNLYVVSSCFPDRVLRYDGQTGAYLGAFATPGNPSQLIFSAIPDPALNIGDFNSDGCVDRSDLTEELLPAIRSGSDDLKFDLNGDSLVNIVDVRKLVLLFTNPRGAACE